MKVISIGFVIFSSFFIFEREAKPENKSIQKTPVGFLVSDKELVEIKEKAEMGTEPYCTNVSDFLVFIDSLIEVSADWPPLEEEIIIVDRIPRKAWRQHALRKHGG